MTTDPLFGKSKWHDTELEKDFQQRVVHLFRLYGWKVYSVPDSRRASLAGYPDLTMWKGRQLVFAELKREKGVVSVAQEITLKELSEVARVFVWRPSDWEQIERVASGAEH